MSSPEIAIHKKNRYYGKVCKTYPKGLQYEF